MACKQCGADWKKDISVSELNEEVKRRKVLAKELQSAFFARHYPHYTRETWLTILGLPVALIAASFLVSPITLYVFPHAGAFTEMAQFFVAACIFFLIFTPGAYMLQRKENRMRRNFKEKYPEQAEALMQL